MTMGLNPISARVMSGKPRRSQRALSQTAKRTRRPIAAPKTRNEPSLTEAGTPAKRRRITKNRAGKESNERLAHISAKVRIVATSRAVYLIPPERAGIHAEENVQINGNHRSDYGQDSRESWCGHSAWINF